jgi:uncharacterized membrane protein
MEFVSRDKLEKFLNLLLGISWSMVVFGTLFTLIVSLGSSSVLTSIVITFILFFVFAVLVLFLEGLKIQLQQGEKIDKLINKLERLENEKREE